MRMVGSWIGRAQAPSGWLPAQWDVTIAFTADQQYTAYGYDGVTTGSFSYSAPVTPAFYYGTDDHCAALHKWRLTNVSIAGNVGGQIDIPFWYGPSGCGLAAWQGELDGIELDASGNRLQLSFNRSDGYGPVNYDLYRLCGP